jgi:hypothetical protein
MNNPKPGEVYTINITPRFYYIKKITKKRIYFVESCTEISSWIYHHEFHDKVLYNLSLYTDIFKE